MDTYIHGWMSKRLLLDLTRLKTAEISTEPCAEKFLGGRGIATSSLNRDKFLIDTLHPIPWTLHCFLFMPLWNQGVSLFDNHPAQVLKLALFTESGCPKGHVMSYTGKSGSFSH